MQSQPIANWYDGAGTTLFYLCVGTAFLHFWIEALAGISIVRSLAADFMTRPIPEWAWPTWLAIAYAVSVVAGFFYLIYAWNRDRRRAELISGA